MFIIIDLINEFKFGTRTFYFDKMYQCYLLQYCCKNEKSAQKVHYKFNNYLRYYTKEQKLFSIKFSIKVSPEEIKPIGWANITLRCILSARIASSFIFFRPLYTLEISNID